MPETFTPITWADGSGGATPITAAQLNRIETGVESMDDRVTALEVAGTVPVAIVDAKGDLIAATAADTVARLPVGTNGQVLKANSATATGLEWAADISGSGGVSIPQQAGETGVVDTSYPVGHGHRYGISVNPNTAIAAMRDLVLSTNAARSRIDTGSGSGDRIPYDVLYLPAGSFTVTQIGAFLSGSPSDGRRTRGIVIRGAGRFMTEIVFNPASSGYLFDNQDRASRITFEDLTFTGGGVNANFMNSVSNGGPQNYIFNRVVWRGTWSRGVYMSGTDTDSECRWYGCTIYGEWTTFLENDNPQGLNYDFIGCDVEMDTGWAVQMDTGGSVNVFGGSWMGSRDAVGGVGGFFKLTPTSAAPGSSRLLVEGIRVEHRSAAWKLIECSWPSGTVTFVSCGDVGNSSIDTNATRATFTSGGGMPVISFENCRLAGRHEYIQTAQNDNAEARLITYRNTILQHRSDPTDFIIQSLTGGAAGRDSAYPPIRFERCRSGVSGEISNKIWDQTLNNRLTKFATLQKQTVSIKVGSGDLPAPGDNQICTLPFGAIITGVRLFAPAGASSGSSTSWNYTVTAGSTSPTTLLSYGGAQSGAGMNVGYSTEVTPFFVCNTADKRIVTLTAAAANSSSGDDALCLVEYLS